MTITVQSRPSRCTAKSRFEAVVLVVAGVLLGLFTTDGGRGVLMDGSSEPATPPGNSGQAEDVGCDAIW